MCPTVQRCSASIKAPRLSRLMLVSRTISWRCLRRSFIVARRPSLNSRWFGLATGTKASRIRDSPVNPRRHARRDARSALRSSNASRRSADHGLDHLDTSMRRFASEAAAALSMDVVPDEGNRDLLPERHQARRAVDRQGRARAASGAPGARARACCFTRSCAEKPPGTVTFGRASYSHLLAYSRGAQPRPERRGRRPARRGPRLARRLWASPPASTRAASCCARRRRARWWIRSAATEPCSPSRISWASTRSASISGAHVQESRTLTVNVDAR